MMRVDEITEGSRVKWLENRSNIESAQSEVCGTRIWFDVATEKKENTKIRITYECADGVSEKNQS